MTFSSYTFHNQLNWCFEPVFDLRASYSASGPEILKGISFRVEANDFFAIIGPSGAGKSTLIRCINRLVEPSSGEILFYDREVTKLRGRQLRLLRRDWSEVRHNTEVRGYYLTLALAISLIAGLLWVHSNPENLHELLRQSAFQVVSIMTTTGYTTTDFDAWAPATHAILLVLMVIGGSSGSTSGGLKVVRLIVALRICRLNIEKAFRTHVVRSVKINGVNLDQNSQEEIITYLALIGLVFAGSAVLVNVLEPGTSFTGGLTAMMASLFNIGPGLAEVGPTRNYAGFHDLTKYFLSLLMIMGRLELYAILDLFSPSLWRRFS